MPGEFKPIAKSFYKKVYTVFKKVIKQAEEEARAQKLDPIHTFLYIDERVKATYVELEETMGISQFDNFEFDEKVYRKTDKHLIKAREQLIAMVDEVKASSSLSEMIERGRILYDQLKEMGVLDELELFDIDFDGSYQPIIKVLPEYDKYIFDLDYTLLIPDWSKEDDYLREHIPLEEQEEFFKQKQRILDEYEATYPRYDLKTLSEFFKQNGFTVTEEVISGWMTHNGETINDEIVPGVVELFSYLKLKGKKIVILTNWFGGTQRPRLERTGLLPYIDQVVSGEDAMKPSIEAFNIAIGDTDRSKCIMVGDSIRSDAEGARNAGIDYYIVSSKHTIEAFFERVAASALERSIRGVQKTHHN